MAAEFTSALAEFISKSRSKAQVISRDDDQSSLAVYAEHYQALEPRFVGFSVYRS